MIDNYGKIGQVNDTFPKTIIDEGVLVEYPGMVRIGDEFFSWAEFNAKYSDSHGRVRLDEKRLVENFLFRLGLRIEDQEERKRIVEYGDEVGRMLYEYYLANDEPAISQANATWKGEKREVANRFLESKVWLEAEGRVSYPEHGLTQAQATAIWLAFPETNLFISEEVEIDFELPENSEWTILKQYYVRGILSPKRADVRCSCGKVMKMQRIEAIKQTEKCKSCAYRTTDFEVFYKSIEEEGYTIVHGFREKIPTAYSRIILQCPNGCEPFETHQNKWINKNQRCPGCSFSVGEKKAAEFLKEKNVPFETQVSFDSLVSPIGNKLRYDFMIELNGEKILIEIDGEQHFKVVEHWGGKERYEQQVLNDQLKDSYAAQNSLRLVRIQNIGSNHEFILNSLQQILDGSEENCFGSMYDLQKNVQCDII